MYVGVNNFKCGPIDIKYPPNRRATLYINVDHKDNYLKSNIYNIYIIFVLVQINTKSRLSQ